MTRTPAPARRGVLAALVLGSLAGCGIRLEEDAPQVPLVPTRTPIPGEDALLALLHGTWALSAGVAARPDGAPVVALLDTQAGVLDSALRERGVPQSRIGDSASATGSGTATASGTGTATATASGTPTGAPASAGPTGSAASAGVPTKAAIAAELARSSTSARTLLEAADEALRPMLASLAANRAVLGERFGARPAKAAKADPDLPPDVALALLATTRECVYGAEVAAARAGGKTRERAISTLDELRALVLTQEEILGADTPPTPTAYALPLEVDDNASAKRLIALLLDRLVRATAAQLAAVAGDPGQLVVVTDWLTQATTWSDAWGAKLTAFPGMT